MKKITKKLCSEVCALLAFSGNRGGALTKEILCNAGQWLACVAGYFEYFGCFYRIKSKTTDGKINKTIVPHPVSFGRKILGYSLVAATVGNAVDSAKRSYDIIKVSKNKFDAKKGTNLATLEAIFGVFQLAFSNHDLFLDNGCHFCHMSILPLLGGSALLVDAYSRFRENNQTDESQIPEKNSDIKNVDNIQKQKAKDQIVKQQIQRGGTIRDMKKSQ